MLPDAHKKRRRKKVKSFKPTNTTQAKLDRKRWRREQRQRPATTSKLKIIIEITPNAKAPQ